MILDISKLPPWAQLVITKEQLDAYAEKLIKSKGLNPSNSSEDDEVLTIDEATKVTKLAKQTIYQLCSKRGIPYYKKNKRLYFKKSELLKWLEEGKQEVQEEEENEVRAYLHRKQKGGRR